MRPSRTNTQERCPFHHRGLEFKSRKSRDTWSNKQIWHWIQNEAGQRLRVLPIERPGHGKLPFPTRGDFTHVHHQTANTEIRLIIFFAAKDQDALWSQEKTRLGADCGSNHELLIGKFSLKLKKVGKSTRPFRYDLNEIPYDYTVGVRNRFKGLDLIDRVPEELWMEVHDTVWEAVIKTIPKKKKCIGKTTVNKTDKNALPY